MLYLIEILHQTTTEYANVATDIKLYLIEILHQTTTAVAAVTAQRGCILSKFYIKPQPGSIIPGALHVVSYRNSTSNHNSGTKPPFFRLLYLIEILHQTTTWMPTQTKVWVLYLIEILHQTTTVDRAEMFLPWLYLIEILHQTTTVKRSTGKSMQLYLIEILHQTTTMLDVHVLPNLLYLIEILHQTTTVRILCGLLSGCILSKFYIKPQRD